MDLGHQADRPSPSSGGGLKGPDAVQVQLRDGKEVVQGAAARHQVKHGGQRPREIDLRPLHRRLQVAALCQIGGDGTGERAACPVGVGVMDPASAEPFAAPILPQQVVGVVQVVPALAQHSAAVPLPDLPGSPLHVDRRW